MKIGSTGEPAAGGHGGDVGDVNGLCGRPALEGALDRDLRWILVVRLTYHVILEYDGITTVALRRLVALDGAQALSDLLIPPSNRLEGLRGDRKGQHSIRINDQYRICFTWRDGNAEDVEITKHYR